MRQSIVLLAAALVVLTAGQSSASPYNRGTLDLDFGPLSTLRFEGFPGLGVDLTSGGSQLSALRLYTGFSGTGVVPVTDPESTPTVKSIRITATLGSGTLTGISGAPPLGQSQIPVLGFARVCLYDAFCSVNLPLDLTLNDGNTGVGIGGRLTGSRYGIRISIQNAPWTLGTVSGINQTAHGGFKTLSRAGFVHGAASATSATVLPGRTFAIQLIAPQQVRTQGLAGNHQLLALFPTLTLLPEPGLLLLIGSGVVGLGVLGRGRMKRREKPPGSGGR